MKNFICALFLSLMSASIYAADTAETIVFLRHGEKPSANLGQLNCQGLNRSLALAHVLSNQFGSPDFIFAPNPNGAIDRKTDYVRPLATIEPTAIQLNKPVNTSFAFNADQLLADELLAPAYHHSLIFVAWEHKFIPNIARLIMLHFKLDPKQIPDWDAHDFDSLYVINIKWHDDTATSVNFIHDQENLNNQKITCPADASLAQVKPLSEAQTQTLILIPEAEHASDDLGQLNCQGLNRALALPQVLNNNFGLIDTYIAPNPPSDFDIHHYVRALMTLEPAAINAVKALNLPFGYKHTRELVAYLDKASYHNQTLAIAWRANKLPFIARAFLAMHGGDPSQVPEVTPDSDTMYEIKIRRDGVLTNSSFVVVKENLNNLSRLCG